MRCFFLLLFCFFEKVDQNFFHFSSFFTLFFSSKFQTLVAATERNTARAKHHRTINRSGE